MSDEYEIHFAERPNTGGALSDDSWTLFMRDRDSSVCVTVVHRDTAMELQRQLADLLKPKPPKVTVYFAGGPWDGQHTEVDMATAPLFAVGHSIGGHYWLDTKSGDKPTYHWDGHVLAPDSAVS